MTHYVPFARTAVEPPQTDSVLRWLGVDELLAKTGTLPPTDEFQILLSFLAEFAGGLELAEHRMEETLMEDAAICYNAYGAATQKIKARLLELYRHRTVGECQAMDEEIEE